MTTYMFEANNPSYGTEEDVTADLKVFKERLQKDSATSLVLNSGAEELVRNYVKANHRAADWYNKAREKRRQSRVNYARGRIILLVLLPIGIFGLTYLLKDQAEVTQATILLTGLMAAFRASSQWTETKFAASNFAKAASELKEKIYEFESKWKGKAFTGNNLTSDCETALKDGIKQAREIVRKQRENYFTASSPPSIDIMDSLNKARTDVTALIKNYQSPTLAKALKEEEEEKAAQLTKDLLLAEISKLASLINTRDQLIAEKERELANATTDDRKGALKTFIATLKKSQEKTEISLMEKSSELAAL